MQEAITVVAAWAWLAIFALAGVHLLVYAWLVARKRREQKRLKSFMLNAVKALPSFGDVDETRRLDDQIDMFIHDVREAAEAARLSDAQRRAVYQRFEVKDEARPYVRSMSFEMWFNVARTLVEVYPILGILGTLLAIWAALMGESPGVASDGAAALQSVNDIVRNFGGAVTSTLAGLAAAIVLMAVNASAELSIERLIEQKAQVRDVVRSAKNYLAFHTAAGGQGQA